MVWFRTITMIALLLLMIGSSELADSIDTLTATGNLAVNTTPSIKGGVNLNSSLLFPNQTLTIYANFKPSQALIRDPVGKIVKLEFVK